MNSADKPNYRTIHMFCQSRGVTHLSINMKRGFTRLTIACVFLKLSMKA